MEDSFLKLEMRDRVAVLTFNRPHKMNAVNREVHQYLRDALTYIESTEDIRCVVLTGAGRAFCSGQDLGEDLPSINGVPDVSDALNRDYNPFIKRFMALPVPTISAVNGMAAGAGCNIALAADIVIASRSAKFEESFVKIGLVPDVAGSWLLPRLIGRQRALAMMLTADAITADEACDMGLVWKVVDDEALFESAMELAKKLANGPRKAMTLIKKAIALSPQNSLQEQLDLERDLQSEAARHPDFKNAIAAFKQKEKPVFE